MSLEYIISIVVFIAVIAAILEYSQIVKRNIYYENEYLIPLETN
jgi:hypothetical protein